MNSISIFFPQFFKHQVSILSENSYHIMDHRPTQQSSIYLATIITISKKWSLLHIPDAIVTKIPLDNGKYFIYFRVFVCAWGPERPEEATGFPGNGVKDSCKLPHGYYTRDWIWVICKNSQVLLTAKASFQPLNWCL